MDNAQHDNLHSGPSQGTGGERIASEAPPPPTPSTDPGIVPRIGDLSLDTRRNSSLSDEFDVATLDPLDAVNILSRGMQALVEMTGDVPPTPPLSRPVTPTASSTSLRPDFMKHKRTPSRPGTPPSTVPSDDIQSPAFKKVQIGSPEANPGEATELEEGESKIKIQREAIARKFFSKQPPPVSIKDYLLRLHRYCPMSTAVYLAAGTYIFHMALEEKSVPVAARTIHRLLLATLRVAMKALEDLSYPHKRFAGVGGVSEKELARLELAVCYLMDFTLKVDNKLLYEKTKSLQQLGITGARLPASFKPSLPMRIKNKGNIEQTVA